MPNEKKRKSFLEDFLKIRIKGKPGKESEIGIASKNKSLVNVLDGLEGAGKFIDTSEFNQFRTLGNDRNEQYRMYDEMAQDSIISAALELYADDATQYNTKGQVIWGESEDPRVAAFVNKLIDDLQLNDNAWSHIYSLVKYGDLYLQLFKDDEEFDDPLTNKINHTDLDTVKNRKGSVLERYLEPVANPAEIFDLSNRGKTVGFVEVKVQDTVDQSQYFRQYAFKENDNNIKIYEPKKFVHAMLATGTNRFPEKLQLSFNNDDVKSGETDTITYTYDVKRGKSILQDLYKIYREIQLMEDAILLNRVTRSSIIRLLQIEIGDMPKNQAEQLLHRYKKLIEQKNFLDKDGDHFTSAASPGPIDNVLYIPTRDGKGAVSMSNMGGDADVKSIVDLDYFKNKEFGGLKIPKQFLGEDDGGGFSGGTSLTKLDARYARTIKRIQNAYISAITTLVNIFALDAGFTDYINNFTVRMTSPATTEDAERDETLQNRIDIIDRLLSLIPEDMTDAKTRKKALIFYLSNYISEPELAQMLEDDDTLDKMSEKEREDADMSSEGGGGGGFSGPDMNFDMGGPDEGEEDLGGPEDFGEEPSGGEESSEGEGGSESSSARSEIDFSEIDI